MNDILADRMEQIDASGIRKVFALAATMRDPINLSIGQPDYDVPESLKAEAIRAIEAGENRYSQTAGIDELKSKIGQSVTNQYGWDNPKVLVTSGVSGGLLLAFMAMINPGDEVIFPDPYFVMYKHLVRLLGGKCVFVDSYPDFELPVEKIAGAITHKTKLIIINSPSNPTGKVYSAEKMKALAEVAGKHDIPVISDEIYEQFSYEGKSPSFGDYYDKTILLKGFSKAYAMTGWRLGYAAVNESLGYVLEAMTMLQQYTFVCAPTPFQKAAIAALDFDVSEFVEKYKRKRDIIYEGLKDHFEVVRPGGAFYTFLKAPEGQSGTEFVEKAIAKNVLIIPGNVFSEKDTHFRISYANDDDKLKAGVEILKELSGK